MKILDTYQGHGPLTIKGTAGYDRIILKLYDPAVILWTKESIAFCRAHGIPFDVYSTGGGRHEPAATWKRATEIMDALGLDPQEHAVGIDWFEFLVGGGASREEAGRAVALGVHDAHAASCKAGGYAAVLNGWPVFDALHIPFDWDWVADPQTPARRRNDLHQVVQVVDGVRQDVDFTPLDQAAWKALTTGPFNQQHEEDDLTPEQAKQLDRIERALENQATVNEQIYRRITPPATPALPADFDPMGEWPKGALDKVAQEIVK